MVRKPTPHIPDAPPRGSPEAVIHLMRLCESDPFDGERKLRQGLLRLAIILNEELPVDQRVLLSRDPRCTTRFSEATPEELVTASYVAVGAYLETPKERERKGRRRAGYLMLERYFVWSRAMWEEALRHGAISEAMPTDPELGAPLEIEEYRAGGFLAYWLASLCPLIEGWKELDLADDEIDALLAEGEVNGAKRRLFRFRNAAFHFQRDAEDPRFADFMDSDDVAKLWAVRLESTFKRFFQHHHDTDHKELTHWLDRE